MAGSKKQKQKKRLQAARIELVEAVSSCRFEFTDARADEVVKMRLISVLRLAVTGPGGHLLDDDSVWHIVQDCFVHRNQVGDV